MCGGETDSPLVLLCVLDVRVSVDLSRSRHIGCELRYGMDVLPGDIAEGEKC